MVNQNRRDVLRTGLGSLLGIAGPGLFASPASADETSEKLPVAAVGPAVPALLRVAVGLLQQFLEQDGKASHSPLKEALPREYSKEEVLYKKKKK